MLEMEKDLKTIYQSIKEKYKSNIVTNEILSDDEKRLDEYLSKIKKEADALYKSNDNPYGIIEWNDSEDIQPDLYEFCKELPKGGDLHAHDHTMIPFDRFVEIIKENALICVNDDKQGVLYLKQSPNIPEDALEINEAIDKGLLSLDELTQMLVLTDEDITRGYWNKLEQLFSSTGDIYNDVVIMEKIWEEGFESCYEKGIQLLEIRDYAVDDDLYNFLRDRTIREAYYRVRRRHPDFVVRLIGCTGKDDYTSIESAQSTLRSIIRTSEQVKDEFDPEHPQDFIIGLDLVNEEDRSKQLSEFKDILMSNEIQNSGLKLFLHCGESLRNDNDSVVDAYIYNSYRVGHALNLYRYPELMTEYSNKKIAIEVCLMSNYRLGYVKDLRLHPGLIYLINDIPITLCSDDGLYMSRAPLVDDFYSAILCWNLDLSSIKMICRNSIKYSGLKDDEIEVLMNNWERKWNDFVSNQLKKIVC